jgi:hypothetical protein
MELLLSSKREYPSRQDTAGSFREEGDVKRATEKKV